MRPTRKIQERPRRKKRAGTGHLDYATPSPWADAQVSRGKHTSPPTAAAFRAALFLTLVRTVESTGVVRPQPHVRI
jgi:hypothetical protein